MDQSEIDKLAGQFNDAAELTEKPAPIIKVIGVGGGGSNAINHMYRQGIKDVSFVVLNTDLAALRTSPVPTKVMIGSGLGAGDKPEVAREAAEADIEKINAIFNDKTEMVFVTAGMGGGTGTGAGPVVARLAREKGLLTIGIVTIPFLFEGNKKILKALDGADEMAKYVDALLVINNERLAEIYGDLSFMNAFGKADETLSTAASSISEIINADGYINLDFKDVDTTLRNGGAAIISTGYGEGENRVTMAIEDALNSPLLKNRDVFGSKRLLFNLYFSRKSKTPFTMSEVSGFREFVSSIPDVEVIWGVGFDDELGDKVKITILASGFDVTIRDEEEEEFIKGGRHTSSQTHGQKAVAPVKVKDPSDPGDRIKKQYGKSMDELSSKYILLTPEQMDDDEVIELLERTPTNNRDRKIVERFKNTGSTVVSDKNAAKLSGPGIISF
ncbi:MAG: cell division protein FtsZ [Muribaculaceae bacterium]|nr:cell division protein FtsZ [Muribaculaceae bacterium]